MHKVVTSTCMCIYDVSVWFVVSCGHSNSIVEGDSEDEDDDDRDLILENDLLPYDPQHMANSHNLNLSSRDSANGRLNNNTGPRTLPQSISLPIGIGVPLSNSATTLTNHNETPAHATSSSQDSMREDGNIITL